MKSSVGSFARFAKLDRTRLDFKHRNTMDRFLCFVLLFAVLPFTMLQAVEEGACECAVFSMQILKSIIERALQYNVTCDDVGEATCQQLCVALAESSRDKAPQMICDKLNMNVENLHVLVYSKICNAAAWKFTGLKGADPICCHTGKPTVCKEPPLMIDANLSH